MACIDEESLKSPPIDLILYQIEWKSMAVWSSRPNTTTFLKTQHGLQNWF